MSLAVTGVLSHSVLCQRDSASLPMPMPLCVCPASTSLLPLVLAQMPSLHDARLSSLLGALMSAAYCIIAVAMSATVKPGPEVSGAPCRLLMVGASTRILTSDLSALRLCV